MNRPVLVFVGIVYGLAIALSLLVGFTGGRQSPFVGLGMAAMFFPAIAVIVVSVVMKARVASFGWTRLPVGYLLLALFLIPIAMHLVMLPVTLALVGDLPWQGWLTPGPDGLIHADARGWGTLTTFELIGRVALNAIVGLVAVSLLAFFEETGWRAWLLPRLAARSGWRRAIVIGAALWAVWHMPFAWSGIHALDHVSTVMTALILPLGHLGAGIIIGWLWMKTESIWVAMIAHGALNNWGQYAFKYMGEIGPQAAWILLAGNVGLLVAGAWLLRDVRDRDPLATDQRI